MYKLFNFKYQSNIFPVVLFWMNMWAGKPTLVRASFRNKRFWKIWSAKVADFTCCNPTGNKHCGHSGKDFPSQIALTQALKNVINALSHILFFKKKFELFTYFFFRKIKTSKFWSFLNIFFDFALIFRELIWD